MVQLKLSTIPCWVGGWTVKFAFFCLAFFSCSKAHGLGTEDPYCAKRESMVKTQIESRGVRDSRVLDALRKVPRHEFVPEFEKRRAYEDYPIPIGEGQTISQPYIVALMTELLELSANGKVLEIGTGSGYQAAVLAAITPNVYSIEIVPKLARQAEQTFKRLGCKGISVKVGDGYYGWPEHAPFDGIIVTASPEKVPGPLVEQLKEGGRIVIPVGRYPDQTLCVLRKVRGEIEKKDVIPVSFVPMTGTAQGEGVL